MKQSKSRQAQPPLAFSEEPSKQVKTKLKSTQNDWMGTNEFVIENTFNPRLSSTKMPGNLKSKSKKSLKNPEKAHRSPKSSDKVKSRPPKAKHLSKENAMEIELGMNSHPQQRLTKCLSQKVISVKPSGMNSTSKGFKKNTKQSTVKIYQNPQASSNLNLHMNFFHVQHAKPGQHGQAFIVQPSIAPVIPVIQPKKGLHVHDSASEAHMHHHQNKSTQPHGFYTSNPNITNYCSDTNKKLRSSSKTKKLENEIQFKQRQRSAKKRVADQDTENINHKINEKPAKESKKKVKSREKLIKSPDHQFSQSRELKPKKRKSEKLTDPAFTKFTSTSPSMLKHISKMKIAHPASPSNVSRQDSEISDRLYRRSEKLINFRNNSDSSDREELKPSFKRSVKAPLKERPSHKTFKAAINQNNAENDKTGETKPAVKDSNINIGKFVANRKSERSLQFSDSRCRQTSELKSDGNFAAKEYQKWQQMEQLIMSLRKKVKGDINEQSMIEGLIKMLDCAKSSKKEAKRAIEATEPDGIPSSTRNFPVSSNRVHASYTPILLEENSKLDSNNLIKQNSNTVLSKHTEVAEQKFDISQLTPQIVKTDQAETNAMQRKFNSDKHKLEIVKSQNYFYRPKDENMQTMNSDSLAIDQRSFPGSRQYQSAKHGNYGEMENPASQKNVSLMSLPMNFKRKKEKEPQIQAISNDASHLCQLSEIIKNPNVPLLTAVSRDEPAPLLRPVAVESKQSIAEKSKRDKDVTVPPLDLKKSEALLAHQEDVENPSSYRQVPNSISKRAIEVWASPQKSFDMLSEEIDQLADSAMFKHKFQFNKAKNIARENSQSHRFPISLNNLNRMTESMTLFDQPNRQAESYRMHFSYLQDPTIIVSLKDLKTQHKEIGLNADLGTGLESRKLSKSLKDINASPNKSASIKKIRSKIDFSSPLKSNVEMTNHLSKSKHSLKNGLVSNLNVTGNMHNSETYGLRIHKGGHHLQIPSIDLAPSEISKLNEKSFQSDFDPNLNIRKVEAHFEAPIVLPNQQRPSYKNRIAAFNSPIPQLKIQNLNGEKETIGEFVTGEQDHHYISINDHRNLQLTIPVLQELATNQKIHIPIDMEEVELSRKVTAILETVLDVLTIDLLTDKFFTQLIGQILEFNPAQLLESLELTSSYNKGYTSPRTNSDYILIEPNQSPIPSKPDIQGMEDEEATIVDEQFQQMIEQQVNEILDDSTETIYAIRTHFKAINEYLILMQNHFASIDYWPIIGLLGPQTYYQSSVRFHDMICNGNESPSTNAFFELSLLSPEPLIEEFEVIEAQIIVI